jgi:nucleoside-diphosphate-sugar epimerase
LSKIHVLLTGPSGRLGPHLTSPFRDIYSLQTFDLPGRGADFEGDLSAIEPLRAAMRGVEVVVHLAATADEAPFVENLVPANIVGVHNVLEAARLEGVRRVVFASTVQTVGMRHGDSNIAPEEPPRPSTLYGATKVMGEVLGRFYHDKHGLEFIALRIGAFQPYESPQLRRPYVQNIWLSPRDAVEVFRRAIETPVIGFAVVNATSDCQNGFLSLQSAQEVLGFEPGDAIRDFDPSNLCASK